MMTQFFTSHASANYERTDEALHQIRGLTYALDMAMDQIGDEDACWTCNTRATLAKDTIFHLLVEKLEGIEKLRAMEWVGQGGNTEKLTADEIALARGETSQK